MVFARAFGSSPAFLGSKSAVGKYKVWVDSSKKTPPSVFSAYCAERQPFTRGTRASETPRDITCRVYTR